MMVSNPLPALPPSRDRPRRLSAMAVNLRHRVLEVERPLSFFPAYGSRPEGCRTASRLNVGRRARHSRVPKADIRV